MRLPRLTRPDLSRISPRQLSDDLVAGLTVAVIALPLSLAFAVASGVPARYGLYSAIVGGVVAALVSAFTGGSRVVISGPSGAMAAVLIAITARYGWQKAALISLLAGTFQIAAGALNLGRLIKILPFPLTKGFVVGSAIIVFGSQLDHVLGIRVPHDSIQLYDRVVETIRFVAGHEKMNLQALGLAGLVIALMTGILRISPRIPAGLIAIVSASLVAFFLDFQVPYVRDIPRYLPTPAFPGFSWEMFRSLLRPAIIVAALGAIETLLAANMADNMLGNRHKTNPNSELMAQGAANVAVSFFSGVPCTAGLARTAVNVRSGARTPLASVFHSLALFLIMLVFAPYASRIPIAALAGVLIVASARMIDLKKIGWLMKGPRSDIAILAITLFFTVFTDLALAVEFGLGAAAVFFIHRMSAALPQSLPVVGIDTARSNIRIYRLPGPLFWGASHTILDRVVEQVEEVKEAGGKVDAVILKMKLVTYADASGIAVLDETRSKLKAMGTELYFCQIEAQTLSLMTRMGLLSQMDRERVVYDTLEQAKAAIIACPVPSQSTVPSAALV